MVVTGQGVGRCRYHSGRCCDGDFLIVAVKSMRTAFVLLRCVDLTQNILEHCSTMIHRRGCAVSFCMLFAYVDLGEVVVLLFISIIYLKYGPRSYFCWNQVQ